MEACEDEGKGELRRECEGNVDGGRQRRKGKIITRKTREGGKE